MRELIGRVYDVLPFKQPLLELLRPLPVPPALYRHLHFRGVFQVETPGRPLMLWNLASEIENEIFWEGLPGRRERVSLAIWMKLCEQARVVVDVGANTGIYALVAKAVNPEARVLAFEPVTRVYEQLVINSRLNAEQVESHRVALSNRDGKATFFDFDGELPAAGSLERGTWVESDRRREVEVETRRLDSLIETERLERLDVIKIDVEGHEPSVLEGMGRYLREFRPTMLVEVLTDAVAVQLAEQFEGLQYAFFDLDEITAPRRLTELRRSSRWNVLVCPEAAADAVVADLVF